MSEILQANIFFFITSIAVIVFTMLICVLLYHLIKIVKSIRRVSERIEAGSEIIAEDMASFRKYFTEGGFVSYLLDVFFKSRGTDTADVKRPPQRTKKPTKKPPGKVTRRRSTQARLIIQDND